MAIGAIIGGISALGSIFGGISASKAKKKAARAAVKLHDLQGRVNQRRLDRVADDILYEADFASRVYRERGVVDVGRYRTAAASSGVDVSSGSARQTQARGQAIALSEAAMVLSNARRQASEYRRKGKEERRLADKKKVLAGQTGSASSIESYFGAASSMLSGMEKSGFFK